MAGRNLGEEQIPSMHESIQWDNDLLEIRLWNFSFAWGIPLGKLQQIEFHRHASEMVFLEIFAGSGNLSTAVKDINLSVYAVDNQAKRHSQVSIHVLDLTKQSDVAVLLDLTCHANIASAHLAPPCGTASRARERPLPASLAHIRADPLRSAEQPLGLEGLTGLDATRVAAANALYALTIVVFLILYVRGSTISIENPANSYFWAAVEQLMAQHAWLRKLWDSMEDNTFQNCMYGSDRDKWTTLKATKGLYTSIRKKCDGKHQHRSWVPQRADQGVHFPTSMETAYPKELCNVMADNLFHFLQQQGVDFPDLHLTSTTQMTARNMRQFGKKQLPPLLSEYWLVADESLAKQFNAFKALQKPPPISEKWGKDFCSNVLDIKQLENDYATKAGSLMMETNIDKEEVKWCGVYRTPLQAVEAASNIMHPIDSHLPVPDPLLEAVFEVLCKGPQYIADKRVEQCKRIIKLTSDLKIEEEKLHANMHPDIAKVLKGKRILLWKKLLEESGYEDLEVVDETIEGFSLVGTATVTKAYPLGPTPAQQSVNQLKEQAVWRRRSTIGKCASTGNAEVDSELWTQTMDECEAGWLSGPYYSEADVSRLVGTDSWICTRRFPLQQPNKVRLIDDGLDSGLNSAFSSYNKLKLMDMDSVVSLVNVVMKAVLGGADQLKFRLSNGEVLEGALHPAWKGNLSLLGRTLDLTAAYKQLPVNPKVGFVRTLVAYDPVKHQKAFFLMNSLPFGATSSVYAFNRVARSLWFLMVKLGSIWTTQYYDDFPNIELAAMASSSRGFMEFLLNAVGWRFASTGKKAPPFAETFRVLGVEVELSQVGNGKLIIANKQERVDQIKQFLCDVMDRQKISSAEASSLHGQLNFAQGQYYGCSLKPGMAFLQQILSNGWRPELKSSLGLCSAFLVASLMGAPPRTISVSDEMTPVLLFTDGAYEPEGGGMKGSAGLVIIDPVSKFKIVQEVIVPDELHSHWQRTGSKQLIALMELWPVAMAFQTYGKQFSNRRWLSFIDNNAVRDGLIKGSSPLCDMFSLLSVISLDIAKFSLSPWFTRIPSKSNPADDPSRGQSRRMAEELGAEVGPPLVPSEDLVNSLKSNDSFITYMQHRSQP